MATFLWDFAFAIRANLILIILCVIALVLLSKGHCIGAILCYFVGFAFMCLSHYGNIQKYKKDSYYYSQSLIDAQWHNLFLSILGTVLIAVVAIILSIIIYKRWKNKQNNEMLLSGENQAYSAEEQQAIQILLEQEKKSYYDGWKCACGRLNQADCFVCACGQTKPDLPIVNAEPVERVIFFCKTCGLTDADLATRTGKKCPHCKTALLRTTTKASLWQMISDTSKENLKEKWKKEEAQSIEEKKEPVEILPVKQMSQDQAMPIESTAQRLCKYCGAELIEGAVFCVNCGKKIEPDPPKVKYCRFCGSKVKEGFRFCMSCGKEI